MRYKDIKCTLVIGSGPIVIGQAAEFDYSGSQACLALREEGIRTVLLNSNPATIQTDRDIADRIYIEPIEPDTVIEIIKREGIDSILPSTGGQVGLNLVVLLDKLGILSEYNIRVLGTPVKSIELAEDRKKFFNLMRDINEPVISSYTITKDNYINDVENIKRYPLILRTGFSLGGSGGTVINSRDELLNYCKEYFLTSDLDIEVDESLLGLKELEYEMIRDNNGNCISVCNMENLDPMGIHTGESIVVTPSQTLSNDDYQMLRKAAIHVVSAIGVIGACNIQFALDQKRNEYYVVEVNPRTSRSSALASKASGYPIARISTKIAIGYNLNEIINPITKNTYAAFEPSLDYVTVKIPRWPFDKFSVSRRIGIEMKSTGEVMGIGRTFEEALMKAISSIDIPYSRRLRIKATKDEIIKNLEEPTDLRIFYIFEALFSGLDPEYISKLTKYDVFFIYKMKNIVDLLSGLKNKMPDNLKELKKYGISDAIISYFTGIDELSIIRERLKNNIVPSYKNIDTCSGEFESDTPYLYSTYDDFSDMMPENKRKIIVIGSGPNRIAQGVEFDYGSVKAIKAIKSLGYQAIMVNSNPETVSTDFDVSDRLYFEPITLEHVSNIIYRERPAGIIIQFSGQTGQNIAMDLNRIFNGIILGTQPESINIIENRVEFSKLLSRLNIKQPDYIEVNNINDVDERIKMIKLPVIIRSSFIIGGRAMDIIYDVDDLKSRVSEVFRDMPGYPVLISEYISNATEMDVDFVSDGEKFQIAGISVHVEEAGTHSGDASMILGPRFPSDDIKMKIENIIDKLVKELKLKGISNLQIAVKNDEVYIIELNARSSRSVPFVSKATGIDWASIAVSVMLGMNLEKRDVRLDSYFLKIPVFPFRRFRDMDTILGPEMKSTGEAMCCGKTLEEAFYKASKLIKKNFELKSVLITVNDNDKERIIDMAYELYKNGVRIYATPGTSKFLREHGIENTTVYRIKDMREPRLMDIIINNDVSLIINTPTNSYGSIRDGFSIRQYAIRLNIPLITNVRFAEPFVKALIKKPRLNYMEISEYF
ncbi:carbamoyl-phosphate synthase (glutamine-hydrolyzing) large subunit [Picrophilus oshimae]|uniref:Carbamoyl-phosphate synthase n=1 Tax=Picrophilus torridus (strain ATCC 700027 / DSM 9790 / JCM 10055 / NBRC 100828 / KAW 2/3) TaxID=1122961 RepID=Q6L0L8_PICTO|nr:carbamoyl-phosphate synthase (glutamine-hydrolyzing) large subunit [Picrophilus oshimae]AAT43484.1 carbamoyl-phosphate synthase [Picrophilus oshimae DSM 9789]